jgi:hypothetical protein
VSTILLMLAVPASGAEDAPAAEPGKTLHFRLLVGADPGKPIAGRLVEVAAGEGLGAALLDLDGDGTFETKKVFRESVRLRTKRPVRDARVRVEHQDVIWTLEIDALRSPARARTLEAGETRVHWSAQAGDLYVRFMEAPLVLHAGAKDARTAKAFRMGPPLTLEIGASSRGPHALVTIALREGNGGKLAVVMRGKDKPRPDVKVLAAEEVKVSASPGYS